MLGIKERAGITIFRQFFFVSQYRKTSYGKPLVFQKVSGIEKFYASEGYITIFRRKILSHSAETFRRGTLLSCVSGNFR